VPLLLGLLALLDLRVELQLLADHFTLAAVGGAAPLQPPAGGGCNGAVTLPYNSLSRKPRLNKELPAALDNQYPFRDLSYPLNGYAFSQI
jgi:hypothetical protein